ncbi:signal peptidase I [Streptomyces sp. NBC_00102]|uniref:signal peptidase I n=1 Tax=Streptomyces sp. NBC_00102 TaxID=2975652 RepID=UPI00225284AC|nr:signal peptidase I [Streptomyces sp. NBC_00102]MCX5400036.1 signal peptidase I [Streptomyces sp. NBC_00102]
MSGTGRTGDGHGRLGSVLSGLAVAVGCVLFLGGFAWAALVYRPYTVPTGSMSPTVETGSKVLAQRISGDEVRRGDVVVFTDKAWSLSPMVKRVIGIGGDTVVCCDAKGRLTVNDVPIEEPYLHPVAGPSADFDGSEAPGTSEASGESGATGGSGRAAASDFSAEVPEGELFLLGDDRDISLDSRMHLTDEGQGSVPRDAVEARVDAVAFPSPGMLDRPEGFTALPGGISSRGPLPLQLAAVVLGVILILAGCVYGPIKARTRRRAAAKEVAGAH